MSDRNFSRRRRGGMRFRPSGGLGHASQKPDRDATEARAEVVGGTGAQDKVYERRHAQEIERAENIAAGLPPEGLPPTPEPPAGKERREFREPRAGGRISPRLRRERRMESQTFPASGK